METVFGGFVFRFCLFFLFGNQIRASCSLEGFERRVPEFRNKQQLFGNVLERKGERMWTGERIVDLNIPGSKLRPQTPNGEQPYGEEGVMRDELLVVD